MAIHLVNKALLARALVYGVFTGGFGVLFTYGALRLVSDGEWATAAASALFAAVFWFYTRRWYRRVVGQSFIPEDDE